MFLCMIPSFRVPSFPPRGAPSRGSQYSESNHRRVSTRPAVASDETVRESIPLTHTVSLESVPYDGTVYSQSELGGGTVILKS